MSGSRPSRAFWLVIVSFFALLASVHSDYLHQRFSLSLTSLPLLFRHSTLHSFLYFYFCFLACVGFSFLILFPIRWRARLGAGLFRAIASGDLNQALEFLQCGANPLDFRGHLGLDHACRQANVELLRFLLRAGYPLHSSVFASMKWDAPNAPEIVRTLLAAGCRSDVGSEVLMAACQASAPAAVVEALLVAGIDPNGSRAGGQIAMHDAARHCADEEASLVCMLLKHGGNPHARSTTGLTPLHVAQHPAAVRVLVQAGADPNARARGSCSPLHMATKADVAHALLYAGASVDFRTTPQQLTPLHMSSRLQLTPVMLCLLGAGANPNALSHSGTALHHAVARFRSCYDALVMLLSAGADPTIVNHRGLTPLAFLADRWMVRRQVEHQWLRVVTRSIGALLCAGASLHEVNLCGPGREAEFVRQVLASGLFQPPPPDDATLLFRWKADAKEKLL